MSIIDTLITDRTQADVDALRALYARPPAAWTAEERDGFLRGDHKGAYNTSDMNRVLDAMDYLTGRLVEFGMLAPERPALSPFAPGSLPSETEFACYLDNVAAFRAALPLPEETPGVPGGVRGLTVQQANEIEQILTAVERQLEKIPPAWCYCGEIHCGEV